MPRGGSKKGEHRGAAKREAKRRGGPPKGVSGNPNGRPKGGMNRATKDRLALISHELGVAELGGLMPKEMLLQIARIFFAMGMKEQSAVAELGQQEGVPERQLLELSAAFERHIVLAADTAYKAGSFYHPRLQAIAVAGANGDQSPGDVLRLMLDEIDGEARADRVQARQIEHVRSDEADAVSEILDLDAAKVA